MQPSAILHPTKQLINHSRAGGALIGLLKCWYTRVCLWAATGGLQALTPCAGQCSWRLTAGSWGRGSFHQAAFVHPTKEHKTPFLPLHSPRGGDLFLTNPHNEGTMKTAGFAGGRTRERGLNLVLNRRGRTRQCLSSALLLATHQCQSRAMNRAARIPALWRGWVRASEESPGPLPPTTAVLMSVLYCRYSLCQPFMNSQNQN